MRPPRHLGVGISLTAGALLVCPWLGLVKRRIAEKLGSRATYGEGTQNVLCAILAGAVLVGLAANTFFGLWWLDPAIALSISALCVREGQKAWRGEECAAALHVLRRFLYLVGFERVRAALSKPHKCEFMENAQKSPSNARRTV